MAENEDEIPKRITHPYLETLQNTLRVHKKLLSHLETRMALIGQNSANLYEYDLNENEIIKIKTSGEIDVLKRVIREKEIYYVKFFQQFVPQLEEADKNLELLMKKVKIKLGKGNAPSLKQIVEAYNPEILEQDVEAKVKFYNRLKSLMK